MPTHIRGRRRLLDPQKKAEVCDLVAQGASLEEAAEVLDVSVRTLQREMKLDEDFEHELRLSQRTTPDPLKIMESASRAHWRAAAWLLERSDPEHYAKRPARSASPKQFEAALLLVVEAALEAAAPEERAAVYEHVQAAADEAFTCVFPDLGPWGHRTAQTLPLTPLADEQQLERLRDPSNSVPDKNNARVPLLARPAVRTARPAPTADKSAVPPKRNSHPSPPTNRAGATAGSPNRARLPWQFHLRAAQSAQSTIPTLASSASVFTKRILSPKTRFATKSSGADKPPASIHVIPRSAEESSRTPRSTSHVTERTVSQPTLGAR